MPLLGAVTGGGFDLSHSAVGGSPPSGLIPTENALRLEGVSIGADDEIHVFEPLAITGLQPVEKISAHSFHQKSHSFSLFAKSRCNLSSSFSSTLGESKFHVRVPVIVYLCRQHPTREFSLHPYHRHL